jgi:hypothetical protein
MDLTTRYLGLTLGSPLVAAASPLSRTVDEGLIRPAHQRKSIESTGEPFSAGGIARRGRTARIAREIHGQAR